MSSESCLVLCLTLGMCWCLNWSYQFFEGLNYQPPLKKVDTMFGRMLIQEGYSNQWGIAEAEHSPQCKKNQRDRVYRQPHSSTHQGALLSERKLRRDTQRK
jgi:hypothetical protein